MQVKVYPMSLAQGKLLLKSDFFWRSTTVNCTDFHCAEEMGFIPQLLNCSK